VRNPYIIGSTNPAFDRPAIEAMLQWGFKPGRKNGHVVLASVEQTLNFNVDDGSGVSWQRGVAEYHTSLPPELRWDTPPGLRGTAFPVYPFAALRMGIKGKTRVNVLIGPAGDVIKARLMEATMPEMGLAALAMVDAWRFNPARKKDGTPCYATIVVGQEFVPTRLGSAPVNETAREILRALEKHPERIVAMEQLDQQPKLLSHRSPVYPSAYREAGQPGDARIEFYIDENGDAQLPRIVSASMPEFGYSAVQAVSTWRFERPLKDGKPAIARAQISIAFKSPHEAEGGKEPAAKDKQP
jgi:TonB family protein